MTTVTEQLEIRFIENSFEWYMEEWEYKRAKRRVENTTLTNNVKLRIIQNARIVLFGWYLPMAGVLLYCALMRQLFDPNTFYIPLPALIYYWVLFFFVQPEGFSPYETMTVGELKKRLKGKLGE